MWHTEQTRWQNITKLDYIMKTENEKAAYPTIDVRQNFKDRIAGIEEWLKELHPDCFIEQAHLDVDTKERAYWHYGYLMALQDALTQISGNETTLH